MQVLRTLLLTPVGSCMSNEAVCELMQTCFKICFEMRLSELLRRCAEQTLTDMIHLLFSRLHVLSVPDKNEALNSPVKNTLTTSPVGDSFTASMSTDGSGAATAAQGVAASTDGTGVLVRIAQELARAGVSTSEEAAHNMPKVAAIIVQALNGSAAPSELDTLLRASNWTGETFATPQDCFKYVELLQTETAAAQEQGQAPPTPVLKRPSSTQEERCNRLGVRFTAREAPAGKQVMWNPDACLAFLFHFAQAHVLTKRNSVQSLTRHTHRRRTHGCVAWHAPRQK